RGAGGRLEAEAGFAPVGSACAPESPIESRPCESCGTEQRVCLSDGDGGPPVWQAWGPCQGEVADACAPVGSVSMAPCGRCGTQESLCSSSCTLNVGKCIEPPDAEGYPGSQTFLPCVSCARGGRWGTCQSNCSWGALGACTVLDGGPLAPNYLVVPATVGMKASKTFTMPAANPIPVVDGENSSSPDLC